MPYALGARSRAQLERVHPRLVSVVELAIGRSVQDFSVHDGARTQAEQDELVRRGASRTRNSRHLVQPDGYGHAVDLVPWINGQLRWEWAPIYDIAAAMHAAAIELKVPLVWGGVWERQLNSLPAGRSAMKAAVEQYCLRHPGPDFIDGPHFELARGL